MMSETDLRVKTLKYLYKMPYYRELSTERKNKLYDSMKRVFTEEDFCREHNVKKIFDENGSSIEYCGENITFADKYGAENFIADMCELSMCCNEKW